MESRVLFARAPAPCGERSRSAREQRARLHIKQECAASGSEQRIPSVAALLQDDRSFRTSRSRRRGRLLRAGRVLLLFRRRLPATRLPVGLVIEEDHDRPDLVLSQIILPHRHRRVPRSSFARQARTSLCDAPEDVALGELSDCAVVGEVRRRRAEAMSEMSLPIQVIAMTGDAILIIDAAPLAEMIVHRSGLAQRILEPRELERLAAEGDLPRWRGMNRAELDRGVDAWSCLLISHETEQHRHSDEQAHSQPSFILIDERRVQRLLELAPPPLLAAHEDEDADDGNEHVLKHDAVRHRRALALEEWWHIAHAYRKHQIRDDEQDHGLPERMTENRAKSRHFLFARKVTSASNCAADSVVPKFFGIVPANCS